MLKFDDLPARYHANVDVQAPFGHPDDIPALTEQDIVDLVTFLQTLSDDFRSP